MVIRFVKSAIRMLKESVDLLLISFTIIGSIKVLVQHSQMLDLILEVIKQYFRNYLLKLQFLPDLSYFSRPIKEAAIKPASNIAMGDSV